MSKYVICCINTYAYILQVLSVKDWMKWDWIAIQEFLDSYMPDPRIFSEVLKSNGKFMRRLGGFFSCDLSLKGETLSSLPWNAHNLKYVHALTSWLTALISNGSDGMNFLLTDR